MFVWQHPQSWVLTAFPRDFGQDGIRRWPISASWTQISICPCPAMKGYERPGVANIREDLFPEIYPARFEGKAQERPRVLYHHQVVRSISVSLRPHGDRLPKTLVLAPPARAYHNLTAVVVKVVLAGLFRRGGRYQSRSQYFTRRWST